MMVHLLKRFGRGIARPPAPIRVGLLLVSLLAYGATGFLYFELPGNPKLTWLDGIWYAVVTVTTIGYGDLFPVTTGGRYLVAIPLMLFGIGLVAYVLSLAASSLVEAKSKESRGMSHHVLKNHLVMFNFPGADKVHRLLDELEVDERFDGNSPKVLIDETLAELPPELERRHVVFVRGNPTRDETLTRASLDHAAYAVVLTKKTGATDPDNNNVAITLAIEARAPHVFTVVECEDYSTHELLKKAGCDGIVCTSRFDAHFLTHELLNPGIQEVVDQLTSNLKGQQLQLVKYSGAEPMAFGKLAESCREQGHIAIGLQSGTASEFNVPDERLVKRGDSIVSIGVRRIQSLGIGSAKA